MSIPPGLDTCTFEWDLQPVRWPFGDDYEADTRGSPYEHRRLLDPVFACCPATSRNRWMFCSPW